MEHRSGFTLSVLSTLVSQAGFKRYAGLRVRPRFEIWLIATVSALSDDELRQLARLHFLQTRPRPPGETAL
jgi:hypothetical protein